MFLTLGSQQGRSAKELFNKRSLFEDSDDEADVDTLPSLIVERADEKQRPEILGTPQMEFNGVKDLSGETVNINSRTEETASKYPQQGFNFTTTQSETKEVQPHSEKGKVEKMTPREEDMVVNSGVTDSNTLKAKPEKVQKSSKMPTQKVIEPTRKTSLTDIFGDDSDSDDIFSTMMIQSRKVINSEIGRVDEKVPNDKHLTTSKAVCQESRNNPHMKKTNERRNLFGSSTDDDHDEGGLDGKASPRISSSPSLVAEKGTDGLFDSSGDEGAAHRDQELGRDLADGNASSRESAPRPSFSNPRRENASGNNFEDEERRDAAALAKQFGGARPKSSSSIAQAQNDIKNPTRDATTEIDRPKRLHVPQFGAAFRNSLSATLAKGAPSPESVPGGNATPGAASLEVTPKQEEEQKADLRVDDTREVHEDQGLLVGVAKDRAKMVRPKRRPPSRFMRQKSSSRMDEVDSPSYATSPTQGLCSQEARSDIGSSPDPLRLPPPMPAELSRSEDSASRGTKSPSPEGYEEIDKATKKTEVTVKADNRPPSEKTDSPIYGEDASMVTDRGDTTPAKEEKAAQRPTGELSGEEKANTRSRNTEPTALKTDTGKDKSSLFESSSDSEDLFAKKPVHEVAAVANVGRKLGLFDSSSDSDDLFSSAKGKT